MKKIFILQDLIYDQRRVGSERELTFHMTIYADAEVCSAHTVSI